MSPTPRPADHRALLRDAYSALRELRCELEAVERARTEPIAIVGMGCRFPGGANPGEYWRLLRDGVDAISEIPPERWDVDAFYDPDPEAPGKMYTRHGGFLDGIEEFDCRFFGITPQEAAAIDPQQRLLLEVAWEALEDAAKVPERLREGSTGVFVGLSTDDYARLGFSSGDPGRVDGHHTLGAMRSMAAGRLAYCLGLEGPAMQLDSSCSSSLLAVHQACESLRSGACDFALAGGVNLMLSPEASIGLCKLRVVAPDGRCKTFDARADGYARGEGCGVVALERLRDAQAGGDEVLALIRGSAVNHDGRSNGLTAPNAGAQEAVIRRALEAAGVAPAQIRYVETFGTGTLLGDPIEMRALAAVLGPGRSAAEPFLAGSVKTNLGHLEAAAGIAGLMKVVLALRHGLIPPHLHFAEPNPYIPWNEIPVRIPTEPTPWPADGEPRLAGVSSFGMSGTNVHLVVEGPDGYAAPDAAAAADSSPARPWHLMTLSARCEEALRASASRHEAFLGAHREVAIGAACRTTQIGRSHFGHRLSLLADSPAMLRQKLRAFAAGKAADGVCSGRAAAGRHRIGFLFAGEGSQHPGMGRELYASEPTFRSTLERCAEILDGAGERSLLAMLYSHEASEALLEGRPAGAQPALFALEYALAELFKSWGVEPSIVLGHGVGEVTAACVAGVLSLEDGLRLAAQRGRLVQALSQDRPPASPPAAASSQRIEPALAAFAEHVGAVTCSPPSIGVVSSLTGRLSGSEMLRPDYWLRQAQASMRLASGTATLVEQDGCRHVVEIGPEPQHEDSVGQSPASGDGSWLASLRRGQSDWQSLLGSLGELYVRGVSIDWAAVARGNSRRSGLPTYPFQRQRHWVDPPARRRAAIGSGRGPRGTDHPLLGRELPLAGTAERRFESRLDPGTPAFLAQHRVFATTVLPAAAYLEMAAAAAQSIGLEPASLRDVTIAQPLILDASSARVTQLALRPQGDAGYAFEIFSRPRGDGGASAWRRHAVGKLVAEPELPLGPQTALTRLQREVDDEIEILSYYRSLHQQGIDYGPDFRVIERLYRRRGESLARVRLKAAARLAEFCLHPLLVEGCLQVLWAALPEPSAEGVYLPVGCELVRRHRRSDPAGWCHARMRAAPTAGSRKLIGDLRLVDDNGETILEVRGATFVAAGRQVLQTGSRGGLSGVAPAEAKRTAAGRRAAASVEDAGAQVPALAERLRQAAAAERRTLLLREIRWRAATILKLPSPEELELDRNLFHLGFDSLTAMELKSGLETDLGRELRPTLVFDHPTVEEISRHLAAQVLDQLVASAASEADLAEDADGSGGGEIRLLFELDTGTS